MKIGLVYAMTGEIESLLTQENAQPLQTVAGVPFTGSGPTSSPAPAASARSTPLWPPSC